MQSPHVEVQILKQKYFVMWIVGLIEELNTLHHFLHFQVR